MRWSEVSSGALRKTQPQAAWLSGWYTLMIYPLCLFWGYTQWSSQDYALQGVLNLGLIHARRVLCHQTPSLAPITYSLFFMGGGWRTGDFWATPSDTQELLLALCSAVTLNCAWETAACTEVGCVYGSRLAPALSLHFPPAVSLSFLSFTSRAVLWGCGGECVKGPAVSS